MPPTLTLCVPEDVVTFFLRSLARAVGGTTIGWVSVRAAMASEGAAGPRAVNSGLPPKATFHLDGVPLAISNLCDARALGRGLVGLGRGGGG